MPDELTDFIHKQMQFTANIREPKRYPMPQDVSPRSMLLYQQLFFQNILDILSNAFPVLRSTQSPHDWERMVRDFYAKHKPKRPTFHEIPEEFLHYLSYVRRQPNDPPWTFELAHYEWLELSLDLSPITLADVPCNFDGNLLHEIPVVSPLAWSQTYQYPVHTISATCKEIQPSKGPTYLIVYRDWTDKVGFMHINDFTHALLALLHHENNTLTGRQALDQLVDLSKHPNPAMVIQGGSLLLESLKEHHIILGTKPC